MTGPSASRPPPTFAAQGSQTDGHAIETARACAVFMLVAYHVIGAGPESGLEIGGTHPLRIWADLFRDVRMPLFAFIAGYVYALRPPVTDTFRHFIGGKTTRLLIPGAVATAVFAFLSALAGTGFAPDWPNAWRIFLWPYAHFWFLQAIFVIFLFFGAIDLILRRVATNDMTWILLLAACLLAACGLSLAHATAGWTIMSINHATYLLPFFLAGVLFRRISPTGRVLWLVIAIAGIGLTWSLLSSWMSLATEENPMDGKRDLQSLVMGLSVPVMAVVLLPRVRWLDWFGPVAFTIYLYHVVFAAMMREGLQALQVDSLTVLMVAGLTAGLAGPVLLHAGLMRWHPDWADILRRCVLGVRRPAGGSRQ